MSDTLFGFFIDCWIISLMAFLGMLAFLGVLGAGPALDMLRWVGLL